MARIRIVDAWRRSPVSDELRQRAIMVVAESWAEQRVLMRAFAESADQIFPTIVLHGMQLAISPAGTDPHGPWGIHVQPPIDGRAQELREQLELAARRMFGSKGNPPRLADEMSAFERKTTNNWAPGTPRDVPGGAPRQGYYEPSPGRHPYPAGGPDHAAQQHAPHDSHPMPYAASMIPRAPVSPSEMRTVALRPPDQAPPAAAAPHGHPPGAPGAAQSWPQGGAKAGSFPAAGWPQHGPQHGPPPEASHPGGSPAAPHGGLPGASHPGGPPPPAPYHGGPPPAAPPAPQPSTAHRSQPITTPPPMPAAPGQGWTSPVAPKPAREVGTRQTVLGFARGSATPARPVTGAQRETPQRFASVVGRTMPAGFILSKLEREVLNALGDAGQLTAQQIAGLAQVPDGAAWMKSLIARLAGHGLDIVARGEDLAGQPTYVLRR